MKILYLSLSYVPSRRASSVQVMRMCEAFAAAGHDVTLVAKRRGRDDGSNAHSFYGVAPTFEIERISRPARRGGGVLYASGVAARVVRDARSVDLVYCRDLIGGVVAAQLGLPTVFEAHGVFDRAWQRALWRRMCRGRNFLGLVAISQAMVFELAAADLLPDGVPVIVAHSPANRIADSVPRASVSAPPRIGYVGNLYRGRGVELIVRLAARMPAYRFELVGGSESDLAYWRREAALPNLVFHGFVAPAELPRMYRTFDVLLMPYPRAGIFGEIRVLDTAKYCSPMKMFEYMASGVPIVASDLPVLQEVLGHERNSLIVPYDDDDAWHAAIERLVADSRLRIDLAARALSDLEQFTPGARTEHIFEGLGLA